MGVIRAAGGIVVRDGRVLLVRRPRYDDWSFPKGKAEADETDEECALREVEEETGIRCEIVREVGETRYRVLKGPKRVVYFEMRPLTPDPAQPPRPEEVDELRWEPPASAAELLTWERDVALLRSVT